MKEGQLKLIFLIHYIHSVLTSLSDHASYSLIHSYPISMLSNL